jgi:Asp-tRNA(Asn)/Glu-tRNA(Gln) amidotransferase A subunit family amidase
MSSQDQFNILELTIAEIHAAIKDGKLTVRALVQAYLDRIAAYDKAGPCINAIISVNPQALEEADALDQAYKTSGFVGPLHGIPLIMKDQGDVKGMPTTMGSVLFKDHYPDRDGFVVAKLKKAGALFIGKATLGEMGAGDTHGSLFGSTRNVYDLERTAGGSSGGPGAAVSANFCAAAIGQEGFASIRRPAIWNGIAGMRPTAGLVSRTGVFGGWPSINGSLGPMARTVADMAVMMDTMAGYDPADPVTAMGFDRRPESFSAGLATATLKGARIGILREPMGYHTRPDSDDFKQVTEVFDRAVEDLRLAGAEVIDPIVIPGLQALLDTRARSQDEDDDAFRHYVSGSAASPFASREEAMASPLYAQTFKGVQDRWSVKHSNEKYRAYLEARDTLMMRLHQVMAEHRLDAIVHKAVEHQPTLIADGVKPPFRNQTGAPHINTFLVYVPSVVVPAGFTRDNLPAGITFLGRPYDDVRMINLAHAYEKATGHRRPPVSTP